jgi:hypothetical protein
MNIVAFLTLFLITLANSTDPSGWRSGQTLAPTDWLPEATRAWKDYIKTYSTLPVVTTVTFKTPSGQQTVRSISSHIGEHFALHVKENATPPTINEHAAEALVVNPRYGFRLIKHREHSPWILADLYTSPDSLAVFRNDYLLNPNARRPPPLTLFNLFLPEQVSQGTSFRIVRSTVEHLNGRPLLRMEFENPGADQAGNIVERGWALLSPEQSWVIVKYEVLLHYYNGKKTLLLVNHSYGEMSGQIPLVRRTTGIQRNLLESGEVTSEWVSERHYRLDRENSPDDYTLSAFGLPEPPESMLVEHTPWWLYTVSAGFALLILSGILYKVVGRWWTQTAKSQTG